MAPTGGLGCLMGTLAALSLLDPPLPLSPMAEAHGRADGPIPRRHLSAASVPGDLRVGSASRAADAAAVLTDRDQVIRLETSRLRDGTQVWR